MVIIISDLWIKYTSHILPETWLCALVEVCVQPSAFNMLQLYQVLSLAIMKSAYLVGCDVAKFTDVSEERTASIFRVTVLGAYLMLVAYFDYTFALNMDTGRSCKT
jgi:hypothetical protein